MKKHLLAAIIISIAISVVSFDSTLFYVQASSYQTQDVKKQDIVNMMNLGADYGLEATKNMENGDLETAYQDFNNALNYLQKAENYLYQAKDVSDKEKYLNSITKTKALILATMERIKKQSGTNSTQGFKQLNIESQSSTYSESFKSFLNYADIGMKYADKCLDYRLNEDYEGVIKNADLAITYINKAMKNLKKDTNQRLNADKESAIKDCKDVLVILYCEKAKGEIEHTKSIKAGKNDLYNAIKLNPDEAANLIIKFAKSAIEQNNYDAAIVYLETIANNSSISATHKSTAKELKSQIPKY